MRLEELQPNAAVRGILPDQLVTVVSVQWFGTQALELTYKGPTGRVANELLYRPDEPRLEVVEQGRPVELRRGWAAVSTGFGGAPHPVGSSIRSSFGRSYFSGGTSSASNYCRLRGDVAAPAA